MSTPVFVAGAAGSRVVHIFADSAHVLDDACWKLLQVRAREPWWRDMVIASWRRSDRRYVESLWGDFHGHKYAIKSIILLDFMDITEIARVAPFDNASAKSNKSMFYNGLRQATAT